MTLHQGTTAHVGHARCVPCLRTVAGWITLAAIAVSVSAVPASARFAPFGGAPFDQAVIDSAMAEPDLVYAPALPWPGLLDARLHRHQPLRDQAGASARCAPARHAMPPK
jgi:hypothetical protein